VTPSGFSHLQRWIDEGFAGRMHYLQDRRDAYRHPDSVLEGVQSLVMLGLHYRSVEPRPPGPGEGRISRYAWGTADYHDVLHDRLRQLRDAVLAEVPSARVRGVVDTAPLLERDFARLAGLGWIGKNTMLINRQGGSWFFLAALLTDLRLDYDSPHAADHCGTCRACLDACPTQAFPRPYVLDATRCISYLTIELRDPVPPKRRPGLDDWLFGCDVCQDVCPWNRRSPAGREASFHPRASHNPVDLKELFFLSERAFRERFRHTPLWRARRPGVLRNAALVLGNQAGRQRTEALDALARGLDDAEPLVRGACGWALGKIPGPAARTLLQKRLALEDDPQVRTEIERALEKSSGTR
jgi:epoxyqueuosine reductase